MGCIYNPFNIRTQPRLLGQKAKTYLAGDSIFEGEPLGFGGKLFNEAPGKRVSMVLLTAMENSFDKKRIVYFFQRYSSPLLNELVVELSIVKNLDDLV